MRIGRLRDRIRFEKPTKTRNPTTGATENGFDVVAVRQALIAPLSGSEQITAGAELAFSNTVVTVRYDKAISEINAEWKITDTRTNREYDIQYFDPISSATKFLKITCIHRSK